MPDTEAAIAARRVAEIFDRWSSPDHARLHAGEMTAQEMRSVLAVLGAVRREVEAAITLADAEAPVQKQQVLRVLHELEWTESGGHECAVCFGLRSRGHERGCALDAAVRGMTA